MGSSAPDVLRAHALFGLPAEIVEQRRAVYLAPIRMITGDPGAEIEADLLDHPISRGHLGEVIAGAAEYDRESLCSLAGSATAYGLGAGCALRLADSDASRRALDPAVRRVAAVLDRHGVDGPPPAVLTSADPRFPEARDRLIAGAELALAAAPELVSDLLAHVSLFALLEAGDGRLGSASAREYPGLVLLPEPASPLEAAEAILHEGAHQKYFDLLITRSILGPEHASAPPFEPDWRGGAGPAWPLEQTFAAFHAYSCLAHFRGALDGAGIPPPGGGSLLPLAVDRARRLGEWLAGNASFLGVDGAELVRALRNRPTVVETRRVVASRRPVVDFDRLPPDVFVWPFKGRALVARRGRPMLLEWRSAPNGTE
jgi:hypothetical protein